MYMDLEYAALCSVSAFSYCYLDSGLCHVGLAVLRSVSLELRVGFLS